MHKTTVDKVGVKEVKLKCSGGDKKMVTCMLLAASNGRKARPTVVFKGKGKSKEDKVLAIRTDALILYSSNAWMQTPTTVRCLCFCLCVILSLSPFLS